MTAARCVPEQLFPGNYPRGLVCDTLLICHEHAVNVSAKSSPTVLAHQLMPLLQGQPAIQVHALNASGAWQVRSMPRTIVPTGENQLANCNMGVRHGRHNVCEYILTRYYSSSLHLKGW
jgi:hypothetical protein